VTGTVLSGQVAVGEHVVVSPSGLAARIRSIHAQNRPVERGQAGDRCALNLAGATIAKDAIRRGDVILHPSLHAPADRIDAMLRWLPDETKAASQWMPARLHHAAAEAGARIVLLDDEPLAPGAEKFVQLVLDKPIAAAAGDRFVLRDISAQRTIGGGRFLDLRAPGRRRRTDARRAQLGALAMEHPGQVLAALIDRAPHHVNLPDFARDHALADAELARIAEALGVVSIATKDGAIGVAPATWLRLKRALHGALEAFHQDNPDLPGIGFEHLRLQLDPRLPAAAFASLLHGAARAGDVALDGAWVKLAGHEARLTPQDEHLWGRVAPLLGEGERFRPPRVRDIAGALDVREEDIRRLAKQMTRMGRMDEVAHDHFFLRDTVAEMVRICIDLAADAEKGEFTAAQFRDRVNNGRKVAIQILEFFDRHGVTLRRGDLRRMNRHRLDLFRPSLSGQASPSTTAQGKETEQEREASPARPSDFNSAMTRSA
jgi:selenocysteine-specific elongation factor